MAFIRSNFAPIGGQSSRGRAPQIFSYATADAAAAVDTSGYFNAVADLLNVGDVILRTTFTDGTFTAVSTAGMHVVSSNAAGVVDVNDTLALTVTDTD